MSHEKTAQLSRPFPLWTYTSTDRTYVVPGPPAPTTYAPHSPQENLALIRTRRHTTTDHRRERGGSEQEIAYGADAGSWAVYVALCPHSHVTSMHARTSMALTCPSDTHRSLSTDISIPARQQHRHGGVRLLRSVFRG